ncbi:MAG: AEC family transporter [Oscillatoriaceae bacterium SKW80]|nr:AEC family transporter [Oscillatoriaceae bacterium SKYG93]MCX8122427.1 AEC family transporter [Oscillatoriaceae bacterium SKW80]MDW8452648.1 AEC family transporter [Oscillatoriaceae cyanobacterium SKYGB_i_bin93]HIK28026.1 AEC family transporter [Oscillatoriaceae cyanobacterium M7585_C2015_266]
MSALIISLVNLYVKLGGGVLLGVILGRILPKILIAHLGKFLFWVGIPISIIAFLRGSDLSSSIWVAPVVAWAAILLGAIIARVWIALETRRQQFNFPFSSCPNWSLPTQGSFILAAMVGNTGYMGYPVALALLGEKYFAWALFYDMVGTLFGAYGLGVMIAARFGMGIKNHWQLALTMLQNPSLWCFGFGILIRDIPLPYFLDNILKGFGWAIIWLALILMGMRLSQLSSWHSLKQASISLVIKMLVVPLILGSVLSLLGFTGWQRLTLVLQAAMPPAFATLVIAEAYNLDRDLTVTAIAVGSLALLLTLPIWLWLF